MTFTPEQKSWAIRESGYDPEQYDMADDGFISPRAAKPVAMTQQPAVGANGMPQAKLPAPAGALETFGKEAIHAAPAAAAGGAVFMPTFGAVTAMAAPA